MSAANTPSPNVVTPAMRQQTMLAMLLVGPYLAAHAIVPLVWGDVYPFTSAPMFRDAPKHYCDYRVLGPDGLELSAKDWLTFRTYDGNPVGYGVGIVPPPVIEKFGTILSEEEITEHIQKQFAQPQNAGLASVTVEQIVIGPIQNEQGNSNTVGVLTTQRYTIQNPSKSASN